MADTSTSSPSASHRKRRRLVLACTECHRRKQKCDRLQPCTSCISRGKQALCSYDEEASYGKLDDTDSQPAILQPSLLTANNVAANNEALEEKLRNEKLVSEINDLGYSTEYAFSTLGLIQQLEDIEKVGSAAENPTEAPENHKTAAQYMNCIRQLPKREHMDDIVKTFISDVAWHYDVVDEAIFMEQLRIWRNIPYSTLHKGLNNLPPNIRCFPALLFQALAQGLLFQPTGADANASLEQLKYAPGMTLSDVAAEYSQAGETILLLVGKRQASMVRVQAGLLRASFLKSHGNVIESWHAVGTAIRDAQGMGLQSPIPPVMPTNIVSSAKADDLWFLERRRKLWLILHLWDAHMAVVLGRPMITREVTSAQLPQERLADGESPTPFGIIILGFHTACKYLAKVHLLQSTSQDYEIVEQIHASIYNSIAKWPDWLRPVNPAATFDHLPWLPVLRIALISEVYYVVLALHRAHIFFHSKSRTEALKAAHLILDAQATLFEASKTRHHVSFSFIFDTFDAIVLTSTIFLKYPTENTDMLDSSLRHTELSLNRFLLIGKQSKMARSAYSAILSLYNSLKKRFPTPKNALQDISASTETSSITHGLTYDSSSISAEEDFLSSWFDTSNVIPPHPLPDLLLEDVPGSEMFPDEFPNPALADQFIGDLADYDFHSDIALVDSGL